MHLNVTLDEDG